MPKNAQKTVADIASSANDLLVYHGGRRWQDRPAVQPARANRYECGPGIYATTNASTAAKYAKGGGAITLLQLDPGLNWLQGQTISLGQALGFFASLSRLPKRAQLIDDIKQCAERLALKPFNEGKEGLDRLIHADNVLNLMVNADALGANNGPLLAQWYCENGIDASLYRTNGLAGPEDWVIIFNPDVITRHEVITQNQIDWSNPALDNIQDQLTRQISNSSTERNSVTARARPKA